jgi:hypothetical protein
MKTTPDTDDDTIEVEAEIVPAGTALEAQDRAALDIQIATAKRYPRNITTFKRYALEQARMDKKTAESMFYTLERKGKDGRKLIIGPSIRLLEIIASAWGTIRIDTRILAVEEKWVIAQASGSDLETNLGARLEVMRRITDRNGRRFSEDMIVVTGQAAQAIAYRNVVMKIVPRIYINEILEQAKRAALPEGKTTQEQRASALKWFADNGYKAEAVFKLLGVKGVADLSTEHLLVLAGIVTAVDEGTASIDSFFAERSASETVSDLSAQAMKASAGKIEHQPLTEVTDNQGKIISITCSCGSVFTDLATFVEHQDKGSAQ